MKKTQAPPSEANFRPDCQLAISVLGRGKNMKFGVGVHLRDISGRASVRYRKFLGKIPANAALSQALLAAIEQCVRLHKEKLEIFLEDDRICKRLVGLPGQKQLKDELDPIRMKLQEVRMFRVILGSAEEMRVARELAEASFERD